MTDNALLRPASFVPSSLYVSGPVADAMRQEGKTDPAAGSSAPPNFGRTIVPHVHTFSGLFRTQARTYVASDEAVLDSLENARIMRNDCGIMECIESRQRATALLDWHLEPEDANSKLQKRLVASLTAIIKRIGRFVEYRRNLMEAIWYGRAAVQHRYSWARVNGKNRFLPARIRDNPGWQPINGDKLVWRYEDKPWDPEAGQLGIRVGGTYAAGDMISDRYQIEATDRGLAYFLPEYERDLVAVHKHHIEDGEFEDPRSGNRIHGVGIRSRIYWDWVQKQETLAFLMEFLERTAGGIQVWTYPEGHEGALTKARNAAKEVQGGGKNVVFFPKPMGEDASAYDIQIVEPGMGGIETLHDLLNNYFGHRIKRYILGQTLSSEAASTGLGSGVAELHQDTFLQIIDYDSNNLDETLTHELVEPLKRCNFPGARDIHVAFVSETEAPDTDKKLEACNKAWQMGARIAERDVLDLLGMAAPKPGDRVLENQSAGMGMGGGGGMPGMPGMGGPGGDSGGQPPAPGGPGGATSGGTPEESGGEDGDPDQYAKRRPAAGPSLWDEKAHPRDDDGTWTSGGSAAPSAKPAPAAGGDLFNEEPEDDGWSLISEPADRHKPPKYVPRKQRTGSLFGDVFPVVHESPLDRLAVRQGPALPGQNPLFGDDAETLVEYEHPDEFKRAFGDIWAEMDKARRKNKPAKYSRFMLDCAMQYARKRKADPNQGEFQWITLNGGDGDGTPVLIDKRGNIAGGPKGLEGRNLSEIDKGVAGTEKDKRKQNKPPQTKAKMPTSEFKEKQEEYRPATAEDGKQKKAQREENAEKAKNNALATGLMRVRSEGAPTVAQSEIIALDAYRDLSDFQKSQFPGPKAFAIEVRKAYAEGKTPAELAVADQIAESREASRRDQSRLDAESADVHRRAWTAIQDPSPIVQKTIDEYRSAEHRGGRVNAIYAFTKAAKLPLGHSAAVVAALRGEKPDGMEEEPEKPTATVPNQIPESIDLADVEINQDGMREESRQHWGEAIKTADPESTPIGITLYDDGSMSLDDGRHRLEAAQKAGWSRIKARVQQMDGDGGIPHTEERWIDLPQEKAAPVNKPIPQPSASLLQPEEDTAYRVIAGIRMGGPRSKPQTLQEQREAGLRAFSDKAKDLGETQADLQDELDRARESDRNAGTDGRAEAAAWKRLQPKIEAFQQEHRAFYDKVRYEPVAGELLDKAGWGKPLNLSEAAQKRHGAGKESATFEGPYTLDTWSQFQSGLKSGTVTADEAKAQYAYLRANEDALANYMERRVDTDTLQEMAGKLGIPPGSHSGRSGLIEAIETAVLKSYNVGGHPVDDSGSRRKFFADLDSAVAKITDDSLQAGTGAEPEETESDAEIIAAEHARTAKEHAESAANATDDREREKYKTLAVQHQGEAEKLRGKAAKPKKPAAQKPKFQGSAGGMKAKGGKMLDAATLASMGLGPIPGLGDNQVVRVHKSLDWRLLKGTGDEGPRFTADGGTNWATSPAGAVAVARKKRSKLDIVEKPVDGGRSGEPTRNSRLRDQIVSEFSRRMGQPRRYEKQTGDQGRWVTLNAGNGDGTPVFIDGSGTISKGPQAITGKPIAKIADARPGRAKAENRNVVPPPAPSWFKSKKSAAAPAPAAKPDFALKSEPANRKRQPKMFDQRGLFGDIDEHPDEGGKLPDAVKPLAGVQQNAAGRYVGAAQMHYGDLKVDAKRFQYKVSGIGSDGVTAELKGVKKFNPMLGGQLLVWHDPEDGQTYVVNGHHRHELASRSGEHEGWDGKMTVHFVDAPNAVTARAHGALANIAEGRGTAVDAAKFLRDTGMSPGQMQEQHDISLTGAVARDASLLTNLSEPLFQRVSDGRLEMGHGLAIAKTIKDHDKQEIFAQRLKRAEDKRGAELPTSVVYEMARDVAAAPKVTVSGGLFGDEEETIDTQRGMIKAAVRRELGSRLNIFKQASSTRRQSALESKGDNKLDVDTNRQSAGDSERELEDFDRTASYIGTPRSEFLNHWATQLAKAGSPGHEQRILKQATTAYFEAFGGDGKDEFSGLAGSQQKFSRSLRQGSDPTRYEQRRIREAIVAEFSRRLQPVRYSRFVEADHPRAPDGEWIEKGAGSPQKSLFGDDSPPVKRQPAANAKAAKPQPVRGAMSEARREGTGKDARIVMADGSDAPEWIKAAMIPPAWSQVRVATEPGADVLVMAVDAKKNAKTVYSGSWEMKAQAWKFSAIHSFLNQRSRISSQIQELRSDPKTREEADCLWLMEQQATRPGSEADTKGIKSVLGKPMSRENIEIKGEGAKRSVALTFGDKSVPIRDAGTKAELLRRMEAGESLEDSSYWINSYGATTLEGRHVVETDGEVRLQFVGKEGVWHNHRIEDGELAKMLQERKRSAGDKGQLFATNETRANAVMKKLGGGGFTAKDLRTAKATEMAIALINAQETPPKTDKEYKQKVMEVAKMVSGKLGNRPAQALESYISPQVFSAWRAGLGETTGDAG